MRLRKQRSPALLKRFDQAPRQFRGLLWLSLIMLAGCAGGTSGTSRIADFFRGGPSTPGPTMAAAPTPAPSSAPSPVAEGETTGHPTKKTAKQARAASENAAIASKEAANASAAAALASKQAASVANKITGSGPTNADVSLEPNAGSNPAAEPATDPSNGSGAIRSTPAARASAPAAGASVASVARITPTLGSSALESSGAPKDETPKRAAKLIMDLDKLEKRVDRKNLNSDDSQRDILAQRLLQEAKKALSEHDGVAALSLATKASTLLQPLPKIAESAVPTAP
jgi:hypothetical protein